MTLYLSAVLTVLSAVLCAYGIFALHSARVMLRQSSANAARATEVFERARRTQNEALEIQANVRAMLPVESPVPIPEMEMAGDDFDPDDLHLCAFSDEPDGVPNFQGLPVKENSPAAVIDSLLAHGFIVRFNQLSYEVTLAYQKPGTANVPVRATYRPPAEIFPVNNLHDAGKAATALWAAREFVRRNKYPEFQNYPYL